jgi:hypothetical protein
MDHQRLIDFCEECHGIIGELSRYAGGDSRSPEEDAAIRQLAVSSGALQAAIMSARMAPPMTALAAPPPPPAPVPPPAPGQGEGGPMGGRGPGEAADARQH